MKTTELFDQNGFLNIPYIRKYQEEKYLPFCWIWGGRGIGKTYGVLKDSLQRNDETGEKFIMLRRTKTQTDLITNDKFMPFKTLNNDLGRCVYPMSVGSGMYGFFNCVKNEKGKLEKDGEEIGLAAAVSTSGNIRGYDGFDIDFVFYDEFIPTRAERPIKGEAELLFNALETIGRNRELLGKKPLTFMGLSNSNNVDNPYFLELNIVNLAIKMTGGSENRVHEDRQRGLLLIAVNDSPISKRKKKTSLYQLAGEKSDFAKMALDNDFVDISTKSVKSLDLRHYNPVVTIGGITIYKPKNQRGKWYVSEHCKGSPARFSTAEIDRERFRRKYTILYDLYIKNNILFENHLTEYLFTVYLSI